jgi:hypothetical protein
MKDDLILDRLEALEALLQQLLADNISKLWLTKRECAAHLGVSVRYLEERLSEGMPHRQIAGKVMLRLPDVERWLRGRGKLREVA